MAREVTPIQLPVAATPMDESIWTRVLAIGSRLWENYRVVVLFPGGGQGARSG